MKGIVIQMGLRKEERRRVMHDEEGKRQQAKEKRSKENGKQAVVLVVRPMQSLYERRCLERYVGRHFSAL